MRLCSVPALPSFGISPGAISCFEVDSREYHGEARKKGGACACGGEAGRLSGRLRQTGEAQVRD